MRVSQSGFSDPIARLVQRLSEICFQGLGGEGELYISIQNLFDKRAPIFYPNLGAPGFAYPAAQGDDIIGRRFNVGFRAKL